MIINMGDFGRIVTIATQALDGLLEDDRQEAIKYMVNTMGMTKSEMENLGLDISQEEIDDVLSRD